MYILVDLTVQENVLMIVEDLRQTCTYSSIINFYCLLVIDLLIHPICYILVFMPASLNMNF